MGTVAKQAESQANTDSRNKCSIEPVDYEKLAEETGEIVRQSALRLGYSEERAEEYRQVFGRPIPERLGLR